jgi:hypothetical protein
MQRFKDWLFYKKRTESLQRYEILVGSQIKLPNAIMLTIADFDSDEKREELPDTSKSIFGPGATMTWLAMGCMLLIGAGHPVGIILCACVAVVAGTWHIYKTPG